MAKKKTTNNAPAAAQGGAKGEKRKKTELTVSDERMREILTPLADLLDDLHVKTFEDIIVGREMILIGARQMLNGNPHIDSLNFVCMLCNDIQQFLVQNLLNQPSVGKA